MAKSSVSGVALGRFDSPAELVKEESRDNCTECRIVGGGAFLGLGAYSFWTGRQQIEANRRAIIQSKSRFGVKSRQAGVVAISVGLAWMGLYRLMS